jgi:hypothetical protein
MEVVPPWSAPTKIDEMIAATAESFQRQFTVIDRDVRFVHFICDAETVLHIKILHSGLAKPTAISDILPLNPQANNDWNPEQHESFFREGMINLLNNFPTLQICGVVCDNLPAQVARLRRFLESDPQWSAIQHIPCLNYMINLIFIDALKFPPEAKVLSLLPGIIHMLNSRDAFQIIRRHCPTIVRTRCVYLVDVLGFILKHLDSVQAVFHSADEPLISVAWIYLYGAPHQV